MMTPRGPRARDAGKYVWHSGFRASEMPGPCFVMAESADLSRAGDRAGPSGIASGRSYRTGRWP